MKKYLVFCLTLFLLTINFTPSIASITKESSKSRFSEIIFYVGGIGPNNYTRIQEAINYANDGDIIYIYQNIYKEHLLINKSITLIGENKTSTVIDAGNFSTAVQIYGNYVNLNNLSIRNSGGFRNNTAIFCTTKNFTMINCIIYRTRIGIIFFNSNNCYISNCDFFSNGEGLFANNSNNLNIQNCQFYNNAIAIRMLKINLSYIKNSYLHSNGFGLYLDNSIDIIIDFCAFDDNNDNQGGVFVTGCKNIRFNNSNFCHNGVGINIRNSVNIVIQNCNINWNTKRGVRIGENCNVSFFKNEISYNFHYGIHSASPCYINKNNFFGNDLQALYSNEYCNAQFNYWNSIFGPSLTELGKGEMISRHWLKIRYFPWSVKLLYNVGSTWNTSDVFSFCNPPKYSLFLNLSGVDSDFDGAPDWWEEKWGYDPFVWQNHNVIDEDNDALTNLEECFTDSWGSNPYFKDIFIEIDWMEKLGINKTNKPDQSLINLAIEVFKQHDTSLHIDCGTFGGGELIPNIAYPSFVDFQNLYWNYFLHNDLNNPRKGIFHYGIISNDGDAGYAMFGWDNFDFFTVPAQRLAESFPSYEKEYLIVYSILHELGHGLGLLGDTFGGIDNHESLKFTSLQMIKYLNYKSCMNYFYTYSVLGYSDGDHGRGDFNDWAHLNFSLFKNTKFQFDN